MKLEIIYKNDIEKLIYELDYTNLNIITDADRMSNNENFENSHLINDEIYYTSDNVQCNLCDYNKDNCCDGFYKNKNLYYCAYCFYNMDDYKFYNLINIDEFNNNDLEIKELNNDDIIFYLTYITDNNYPYYHYVYLIDNNYKNIQTFFNNNKYLNIINKNNNKIFIIKK